MATEVVFTNADFAGQGTANTGSEVTATKDGVTFTFSKGYSADESLRCYAHGALTISAESTIEKINFTTTGGKTGGLAAEVTVGATTYSVADLASQARFTEIKVTLGGETPVEPGDDPVAQSVLFKAENAEVSEASIVAAGAVLVDDAALKVENVYEAFVSGTSHTYAVTPENSIEFQKALQVRASTYPAGEDLIGENNNTASTADNKKASPLVLTAKEDVDVVFYYRRQSSNTVYEVEGDKNSPIVSVTHDQNDSKDLIVYDQSDIATKMGTESYVLFDDADKEYAFAAKSFSLEKGHVYTITAKGTTLPLFGFEYVAKASEPVLADPTNCAEAAEAALSVAENNALYNDGKEYSITGYVTAIQTAFNATNKNITFWMADAADGGKVLEAYRAVCETAEDAPAVGDKVTVTGKLTKYNTTPEFAQGCTYVIVEKSAPATNLGAKTIAEFLELKNTKDTCILTGVVANIVNTTYGNFDLCDEADTVYIYGLLTPDGQTKQFESLNVAEKDTLTVLAIYSEYNGKPQVSNAIFVEVKKAAVVAQEIEITVSSITTPGSVIWTDYVAEDGWWQITASNEDYYVSLSNISTTEVPGVYTMEDLDADYSVVYVGETKISLVSGSVTIAVAENGTITAVGEFVGSDGNTYKLNFTYVEPKAENTVNVSIANAELADYLETLSMFGVAGTDVNGVFVQLYLGSTTIAGEYTEEDLNPRYSGIMIGEETIPIYTAAIKIVANADGSYTLTADILCYNNTLYKVTMTIPVQGEGIDEVNAAKKATKSLINGQLVIEKNGVRYNAQGAVIR